MAASGFFVRGEIFCGIVAFLADKMYASSSFCYANHNILLLIFVVVQKVKTISKSLLNIYIRKMSGHIS